MNGDEDEGILVLNVVEFASLNSPFAKSPFFATRNYFEHSIVYLEKRESRLRTRDHDWFSKGKCASRNWTRTVTRGKKLKEPNRAQWDNVRFL